MSCRLRAPACVLTMILASTSWTACHREPPPRDLILITVDTLRADRIGAYGHPAASTPVLDGLAARGVRFDRAFTPMPRTTPGLASLMTGLWPQHHGSREVGSAMTTDRPLLAERLQAEGFRTFGITANGAAGRGQGFARGFERLEQPEGTDRRAAAMTESALAMIDSVAADERLLLWVHYVDPHFPYVAPGSREHPDSEGCMGLVEISHQGRFQTGRIFYNHDGIAESALDSCSVLYDAEVAYTDAAIGSLIEGLESRGRMANALVVFTADHGENLGEQGLFYQHGPSLHDASARVPLIVAPPATEPAIEGTVDAELIGLSNLAPSLLRVLGVDADSDDFDGGDQSPRFRLPGSARRASPPSTIGLESGSALVSAAFDLISSGRSGGFQCTNASRYSLCRRPDEPDRLFDHEADPLLENDLASSLPREVRRLTRLRERWPPETPRQRAVRDTRFKLVEIPRRRGGYGRVLYDLENDPTESIDVSDRHPDVMARLEPALDRWTENLPKLTEEAPERDDETLEQLRALGYID